VLGEGVVFGDEDVGTGSTAALLFVVKAGVGMSAEYHVADAICGAVVWVRGQVVKELVHGNIGGFSGCGLLRTQGAEGGKEFVVNSLCIVEESANVALNSFDTFCGERRAEGIHMG
jgi:hypothetical protein